MDPYGAPGRATATTIDLGDGAGVDNLGFYDSSSATNYGQPEYSATGRFPLDEQVSGYDLSGSLTSSSNITHRQVGQAGKFLEQRGFGWLLDVQDDEESQVPLLEELDIDLTDIYYKVRCVLLPLPYFRLKLSIVRESPDFWGPLLVVLAYSLLSIYGQLSVVSWILTMWFCGSFFVFFLARALGGEVGYTQVLGIVGYCLIPLVVIGLFIPVVAGYKSLSLALGIFGVVWSVYSAGTLLCVEELQTKRPLLLYPVLLLYIYFFSLYSGV